MLWNLFNFRSTSVLVLTLSWICGKYSLLFTSRISHLLAFSLQITLHFTLQSRALMRNHQLRPLLPSSLLACSLLPFDYRNWGWPPLPEATPSDWALVMLLLLPQSPWLVICFHSLPCTTLPLTLVFPACVKYAQFSPICREGGWNNTVTNFLFCQVRTWKAPFVLYHHYFFKRIVKLQTQ